MRPPTPPRPDAPATGAPATGAIRRDKLWIAVLNAPLLLCLVAGTILPDLAQALVVGTVVFLTPGLAWVHTGRGDGVSVLFRAVLASLTAALAALLLVVPFPGPTSRLAFLLVLIAITNVGLYFGLRGGRFAAFPWRGRAWRVVGCVALLYFGQSFVGASRVPPLEDQDMETQGTAYGLMNAFRPTMVTNRGSAYFFAHPLLLHVWIGESALLSGDIDRLAHYHENSEAARDVPWQELGPWWEKGFDQFNADPVLLPTRTPNLFLAAFILFPLGLLVFGLSGSLVATAGACLVYMTLPEVYVRSSYGGYMAVTNFLTLSSAYFFLQREGLLRFADPASGGSGGPEGPPSWWSGPRDGVPLFRAGAASAWTNQKAILLPAAAAAHTGLIALMDRRLGSMIRDVLRRPAAIGAAVLVAAFGVGWAGYVAYGFAIDPLGFYSDHIVQHVLARFRFQDVNLATVRGLEWEYPSILALWKEFIDHSGWLVAGVGAAAFAWGCTRLRRAEGLLVVWIALVAVGFSLTDWRQTKHLALLLPPLAALIGLLWASSRGRIRIVLSAVLVAGIAWNVWRVGLLMADFSYIQPAPIW